MQLALSTGHRFALTALAWSLALFAAVRLSWIDVTVVRWLIDTQRDLALWYGATPTRAVVVDASCSGADVIALCVAVTLAYPVRWSARLLGALGGTALILAINTIRIGTLFSTASQPALFNALHLYIWPAVLVVVTGVYVFAWTSRVSVPSAPSATASSAADQTASPARGIPASWRRFAYLSLGFLGLHAAAAPWSMTSSAVLQVGRWTAVGAERVLTMMGVAATATDNVIATSRGAFVVTQECLLTPFVPLYLAAALALPMRTRTRVAALLLALPVFFVLGIVRVLVLALPPAIADSPLFLAHGFYQFVAAGVILCGASAWALSREPEPARTSQIAGRAIVAAAAALTAGAIAADAASSLALAMSHTLSLLAPHALTSWTIANDPQGALPLLPGFQFGLIVGLWIALSPFRRAWRFVAALAALAISQAALLVALGEAHTHLALPLHALIIRGLAVGIPIAAAWLFFRPTRHTGNYDDFWNGVGEQFPDLGGAPSTDLYRRDEIDLLSSQITDWRGLRVLKTDLWDEARNTRILQWVEAQGADVYGIDISAPTIALASDEFGDATLRASRADVRRIPFADNSFDVIYSMGTIEHFDESEDAVKELARVLKPGGRLILGVPNRFDPFLRPVLVWLLWVLGHYGYGFEKSYSRRALRRMTERAGLEEIGTSGILFIPGWLRMGDLYAHTRSRGLRSITGPLVRLFARISARRRALRRHGYLLASIFVRQAEQSR